jgi:nicotinamidase-related amidase
MISTVLTVVHHMQGMRRALVIVDYQNDFVTGALGSPSAEAIECSIVSKIDAYLGEGDDIFFTMDTHDKGYLGTDEGMHIPIEHCMKGTPGRDIFGKVAEYQHLGRTMEKGTFGSFDLTGMLKGYDEIELCGVATNICIIANAVILKTAFPDSRIIVDPRCTASYDADLHLKALDVMRSLSIDVLDA